MIAANGGTKFFSFEVDVYCGVRSASPARAASNETPLAKQPNREANLARPPSP